MTTPAAAFDRDNEMFGPEEPVTRSAVLAQITERQRELRFLEQDLAELQEDLRYAVCDHQDSTGWRCDHCGQFADHGPEFWDWKDTCAVRDIDTFQLPCSPEYYRWLIRRALRVNGYTEHGTLPLTAYHSSGM